MASSSCDISNFESIPTHFFLRFVCYFEYFIDIGESIKGYFNLCPRMDFLQILHINNSLYTNYENVFIELDDKE